MHLRMEEFQEKLAGKKVSVVIPVYNEKNYIYEVLQRVVATGIPREIVAVDDSSTDGTTEMLKRIKEEWREECSLEIFFKEKNEGKGAALRDGFRRVSGDIVIIQDADFEYDPGDYPQLLEPILDGRADCVFGSRFLGGTHRVLFFWHMLGNRFLTLLSNMLTNLNLTDMETCYKVFRTDVIKNMELTSNRFGFEPEITAKIAQGGWRLYETSISYSGRTYAEGKKINWKDGVAAIWHILKFNLFPQTFSRPEKGG
ncbi:MAG: glycosyltransferase family 2 protein [Thermodesulfobacteriota bacterium]